MRRWIVPLVLVAAAPFALAALAIACGDGRPDPLPASNFDDAAGDGALGNGPHFDVNVPSGDAASLFDAACATGTARALKDPLYMLIVLDASGSMLQDQKWGSIVPALEAFVDDVAAHHDTTFGLGLTLFSDDSDPTMGIGPYTKMDVPIAVIDSAQVAAIKQRLDHATPHFDTPTYAVLAGQYPLLEAFSPVAPLPAGGKKVLVFMTDGVPYPDDAGTDKPRSVQLVGNELAKSAPAGPLLTLAVGIGYFFPYDPLTYDQQFMGQLAVAGGAPNQPCDPQNVGDPSQFCHFQVTPTGVSGNPGDLQNQFKLTLDRIRSRIASCTLALEHVDGGQRIEPNKVNVVFSDDTGIQSIVPEDATNGWTYDDPSNPTRVFLHGNSCDALKANVDGSVTVVLGCDTVLR
jgi:hypothetical protein